MEKYQGSKDPEVEAEHIRINMLQQRIRDARKKVQIASGNADPGIQAMQVKPAKNQPTGRYSARTIMQTDPLEVIKDSFKMLQLNKGINVDEHQAELLSTGPFAEMHSRHAHHGIQLAQLDTTQMKKNVKPGASTGNASQDQMMKALEAEDIALGITPQGVTALPKTAAPVESADAQEAKRQALLRSQAEVDKKLGIGSPLPRKKPETEAEIIKRLGL